MCFSFDFISQGDSVRPWSGVGPPWQLPRGPWGCAQGSTKSSSSLSYNTIFFIEDSPYLLHLTSQLDVFSA